MRLKDLEDLKLEVLKLEVDSTDDQQRLLFNKLYRAIEYAIHLKSKLKKICSIGSDHYC